MSLKLSVLIPMYNASNYISYCLESLVQQELSKENYEVIIFDDGSTDDCYDKANKYVQRNSNFYLYSHENKGESSTRNKLLKLAKGDYIYNLDADDYIVYNSLGKILETATEFDADILGFKTLLTKNFDNIKFDEYEVNLEIQSGLDYIKKNRDLRHEVWWYIIKKSFLNETKLTFGKNKFNADVVFTLSLLIKSNKFVFYPISLHRYVQTPNSVIRSSDLVKRKVGLDNMFAMIIHYSQLIKNLEKQNYYTDEIVLNNLKFRRDAFSVFTIIKMIKYGLGNNNIKAKIFKLEEVCAYPIKDFIGNEYNSIYYKLLVKIINNKYTLFASVILFKILITPIKNITK